MSQKRTHVVLPEDLLSDVDAIVGPRGRSAFLAEVIREAVNRHRLLQILNSSERIWNDEDHPELAKGAEACVRKLREEDLRLERKRSKSGEHDQ